MLQCFAHCLAFSSARPAAGSSSPAAPQRGRGGRRRGGEELHGFTGNCSGVSGMDPPQPSPECLHQLHVLCLERVGRGLLNITMAAASKWHWRLLEWIWIVSAAQSVFCLCLLCSEPNVEHAFVHEEIYFNECGLLRNVNSQ